MKETGIIRSRIEVCDKIETRSESSETQVFC